METEEPGALGRPVSAEPCSHLFLGLAPVLPAACSHPSPTAAEMGLFPQSPARPTPRQGTSQGFLTSYAIFSAFVQGGD